VGRSAIAFKLEYSVMSLKVEWENQPKPQVVFALLKINSTVIEEMI
jgi:hypothetical protein